ncbi:MAG: hypothetical protein CVT68_00985, partial [Actinobacteria bacterium HGW-Actinobacteria-8]
MMSTDVPLSLTRGLPMAGLDGEFWSTQGSNVLLAVVAIVVFLVVVTLVMYGADLVRGVVRDKVQLVVLISPVLFLLAVGLIYPALSTVWLSFNQIVKEPDAVTGIYTTVTQFVGLDNYKFALTDPTMLRSIINTMVWMVLVPALSTGIGLAYAVFIDKAKGEKFLKSLVFMPMAISFVGASVIWGSIMYDFNQVGSQTGMLNALLVQFGFDPVNFLTSAPWNT